MTRKTIAVVIALEVAAGLLTAVTIADLRAHQRRQTLRDVNMWGFRGTPRLKPLARRVAVVGGTAAYGFGVDWDQSLPYYLGTYLQRASFHDGERRISDVVTLAGAGDGAASYVTTLETYAYLKPDIVCIYDGYNDVHGAGLVRERRESVVFRTAGYFPILADVIAGREPRMAPHLAAVDPMLGDSAAGDPSCDGASRAYCDAMADTVAWVLARGLTPVVVTPPYISRRHERQQASLAAGLAGRFGARVGYINMGKTIDLRDHALSPDGVHLTPRGNQTLAEILAVRVHEVVGPR